MRLEREDAWLEIRGSSPHASDLILGLKSVGWKEASLSSFPHRIVHRIVHRILGTRMVGRDMEFPDDVWQVMNPPARDESMAPVDPWFDLGTAFDKPRLIQRQDLLTNLYVTTVKLETMEQLNKNNVTFATSLALSLCFLNQDAHGRIGGTIYPECTIQPILMSFSEQTVEQEMAFTSSGPTWALAHKELSL